MRHALFCTIVLLFLLNGIAYSEEKICIPVKVFKEVFSKNGTITFFAQDKLGSYYYRTDMETFTDWKSRACGIQCEVYTVCEGDPPECKTEKICVKVCYD